MRNPTIFTLATVALLPAVTANLQPRQSSGSNADELKFEKFCLPRFDGKGTVPPCIQAQLIEELCQPNGTDPIDYEAHAQCMCNGSYFSDWRGCQNCLLVHGLRSERDNAYWDSVMAAASDGLCTGTPTADLQSLFAASAGNFTAVPFASTRNTRSFDQFPDKTAVSLYYTPSVTQGPGRITGEAASATADGTKTTTEAPSSRTTASGDDDDEIPSSNTANSTPTTETGGETTTSSDNAAATTKGSSLVMALAGAAIIAAI